MYNLCVPKRTRLDVDNMTNHFFYFIFSISFLLIFFIKKMKGAPLCMWLGIGCWVGELEKGESELGRGVNRMGTPSGKDNAYLR